MSLKRDALILSVAFVISFTTAGIGSALTDLGPWYQALKQPDWKPPDTAFGVIWSTIFTLGAFSGWLAWRQAPLLRERLVVLVVFLINLCLNVLWSWLFFVQHRPDWALVELYFLWASIVAMMVVSWRHSRVAAVLLVPYLAWVTTAGFLNQANIQLNGPF
ncbi:MAG: tryptophan-rich sensory protein [Betaproteobacteria bacterium]|nr:tryptophan-rich sensory protein [Betaproteobacteria bacterium]NBY72360.1 tryptophan-rich sensory protein [Betaproteobacteria bacterium]NDD12502.1 tryptophan-rich sensory protein [Betaproteobacteria bacterium]